MTVSHTLLVQAHKGMTCITSLDLLITAIKGDELHLQVIRTLLFVPFVRFESCVMAGRMLSQFFVISLLSGLAQLDTVRLSDGAI